MSHDTLIQKKKWRGWEETKRAKGWINWSGSIKASNHLGVCMEGGSYVPVGPSSRCDNRALCLGIALYFFALYIKYSVLSSPCKMSSMVALLSHWHVTDYGCGSIWAAFFLPSLFGCGYLLLALLFECTACVYVCVHLYSMHSRVPLPSLSLSLFSLALS